MKTIVLLGSEGQLGTALQAEMKKRNNKYIALNHSAFDIANPQLLEYALAQNEVDAVINCAAYTNVPRAETDVHRAMQINGSALKPVSDLCRQHEAFLVHVSTDYVFDGTKGSAYLEDDIPNPLNVYGISKLVGEMMVRQYAGDYAIVRTAGLYGAGNPDNIVEKLIRFGRENKSLNMVADEVTSPTYADDLAKQILVIVEKRITGMIHATSDGQCNWLEFGRCIFETLCMEIDLEPVQSAFFHKSLRKPLYSVLQNAVLRNKSCDLMPDWRDALKRYLESRERLEPESFET